MPPRRSGANCLRSRRTYWPSWPQRRWRNIARESPSRFSLRALSHYCGVPGSTGSSAEARSRKGRLGLRHLGRESASPLATLQKGFMAACQSIRYGLIVPGVPSASSKVIPLCGSGWGPMPATKRCCEAYSCRAPVAVAPCGASAAARSLLPALRPDYRSFSRPITGSMSRGCVAGPGRQVHLYCYYAIYAGCPPGAGQRSP